MHNLQETKFADDLSVHRWFEEGAERWPDRTAAMSDGNSLSYGELNRRANQLARRLRERGVVRGDRVALLTERSLDLVTGLLAILKAGAAYVPIDPALPAERVAFLAANSGCRVVLAELRTAFGLNLPSEIVALDDEAQFIGEDGNLAEPCADGDLAYAIYTSGSTGLPKGVMITHGNLIAYVRSITRLLEIPEGLRYALASTFGADLGNTALFPALLTGGTLHVLTENETTSASAFRALLAEHAIEFIKITPSHFSALIDPAAPGSLPFRWLVFGGELLPPELVKAIAEKNAECRIFNHYGPTETTIGAVAGPVLTPEAGRPVALGRPLENVQVYLLDRSRAPVRVGALGEICISGAGVGRGYLDRPDLTAERFVACPFVEGGRMYLTGDLGRWRPDKTIEFVGRKDDQFKIRGYRVELGEIEMALRSHPSVTASVVLAKVVEAGERRICAYYVSTDETSPTTVREFLLTKLPSYMVPSHCVKLAELPRLANGKIDRQALPNPEPRSARYEAPVGEVEEAIAAIFAKVIGVPLIGRNDDFFDRGGNSLTGIRVVSEVETALDLTVTLLELVENPTVTRLARHLEKKIMAAA